MGVATRLVTAPGRPASLLLDMATIEPPLLLPERKDVDRQVVDSIPESIAGTLGGVS